ncbi:MAG: putative nickel-responsive regulator [ANME-2 cluster archaeon HR1]|jgi:CopG family nickel-responsive transcriptional regulator|nr:MAG: CopG family transcriptional regulator, nickel-responsive regulator [ANME-2 cluster archaeon]KAF5428466.1 CopG family transcriptional regulator, nickel-responsive regulator [ANME-2 cluster archaeon]MEA3293519.1 nickel-responsive transcriptional regulator NikR [Euryarchaeota archaeon]PPA78739.1 MAG: putative nickel-responsive regulator [ANME-2 cluster archaeon HR1]
MSKELTRIGVSLPGDLLTYFDRSFVNTSPYSRSDVIRNAIMRYIQYYEWMAQVKGERVGLFEMVYNPLEKGLSDSINYLLSESGDSVLLSVLVVLNKDDFLRIIIMQGEGEYLVKQVEKLMALKGIKYSKLTTINLFG